RRRRGRVPPTWPGHARSWRLATTPKPWECRVACGGWRWSLPGPSPLARARQRPVDLPLGVLLGRVTALVVELLAAAHGEVDLDPAVIEVEPERHQRQAPAAHGVLDFAYLLALEQQPARPRGQVVV